MYLTLPSSKLSSRKRLADYRSALAKHPREDCFWLPRTCFRLPEAAVWETAASLGRAADALLAGNRHDAILQIRKAERADILAWGLPVMSIVDPEIIRWRPIDESTLPDQGRVDSGKPSRILLDEMCSRDGWRCRFCGSPVIVPKARERIGQLLPGTVRWTNSYGEPCRIRDPFWCCRPCSAAYMGRSYQPG